MHRTSSRTLFFVPSGRVWPPCNMYPAGRRGRCPGGSGVAPRTLLTTGRTGQVWVASCWILLSATCVIGARAQGKTRRGEFLGTGGGTPLPRGKRRFQGFANYMPTSNLQRVPRSNLQQSVPPAAHERKTRRHRRPNHARFQLSFSYARTFPSCHFRKILSYLPHPL